MGTRSIILTCMGTRGDVQPFCALGQTLKKRGWSVTMAAPAEFQEFVGSFEGLEFADIGRSVQKEVMETPEGMAMRTAGSLKVFSAARAFFNEGLLGSWFQSVLALCQYLQPTVLVLSSFVQLCGAGLIPDLLGLRTRVLLVHTIPMDLTSEFACPTAGWGLGARRGLGCLNSLSWVAGQKLVVERIYLPVAQRLADAAAARLHVPALRLDARFGCEGRTTLYVYSPSVLPKPADWGPQLHVVGAVFAPAHFTIRPDVAARLARKQSVAVSRRATLKRAADPQAGGAAPGAALSRALSIPTPAEMAGEGPSDEDSPGSGRGITTAVARVTGHGNSDALAGAGASSSSLASSTLPSPALEALDPGTGLPLGLQRYLDDAAAARVPVVYFGLGSMLATAFDGDRIEEILGQVKVTVCQLARSGTPLRAVIHTTPGAAAGGAPGAPFHMLTQPVDHGTLLPQCALAVHHGGAGTLHSVLLAGKPSIAIPCIPMTDQRFWAELLIRHRVAPGPLLQISAFSAARLNKLLVKALGNLEEYTANAERLARRIYAEDGAGRAADLIEAEIS
ncbi:hypothetical protein ACKKBG_A06300 [Auxenochlorella protothecoides x Auxenochlorella symbiontica]|uniref:Glycosyltransferase family 28 N-terminal domain-containing protein n=1 Tax=Auxenochlorella protothecoides TaxID=3075 RepID=A0A1D2A4Z7_AUXPR